MLYAFFWVITQCLNFICLHFTSTIPWLTPTCALPPSHTRLWSPCGSLPFTACFCTQTRPYSVILLPVGSGYFRVKPFPVQIPQRFSNLVILHTYLPIKMEQTECSETIHSFIHSLVFSLRGRAGRNQNPVM